MNTESIKGIELSILRSIGKDYMQSVDGREWSCNLSSKQTCDSSPIGALGTLSISNYLAFGTFIHQNWYSKDGFFIHFPLLILSLIITIFDMDGDGSESYNDLEMLDSLFTTSVLSNRISDLEVVASAKISSFSHLIDRVSDLEVTILTFSYYV